MLTSPKARRANVNSPTFRPREEPEQVEDPQFDEPELDDTPEKQTLKKGELPAQPIASIMKELGSSLSLVEEEETLQSKVVSPIRHQE